MITEIDFYPIEGQKGFLGYCSFVYMDQIKITNTLVYTRIDKESQKVTGVYILYPKSKKLVEHYVYPINNEVYDAIEEEIEKEARKKLPHYFTN